METKGMSLNPLTGYKVLYNGIAMTLDFKLALAGCHPSIRILIKSMIDGQQ